MNNQDYITKILGMTQAYALFSPLTKLPYVICEEENYYDVTYFFEDKDEATAAAKAFVENKTPVIVMALTKIQVPSPEDNTKFLDINQLRQNLVMLPHIGVNAIYFKPKGQPTDILELQQIFPKEIWEKIAAEAKEMASLQLTGIYLAQEIRKPAEVPDEQEIEALSEEFFSNLVNASLYMPVMLPEGKDPKDNIPIQECRMPYVKQKENTFIALFSDMREMQLFLNGKKNVRIMKLPFEGFYKMIPAELQGVIINPSGIGIAVKKESIQSLIIKLKK